MYGEAKDVNTNSVVLKVDGNLTLDSGYALTSIRNGTDVGKGLFIYCTGTLTLNGMVAMGGVSCTGEPQDVFLWKDNDGDFNYIRGNGGAGGVGLNTVGQSYGYAYNITLPNGTTETITDNHWISGRREWRSN